jgi:hypothetical protein
VGHFQIEYGRHDRAGDARYSDHSVGLAGADRHSHDGNAVRPAHTGLDDPLPTPDDKAIRFTDGDYFAYPKSRWTVCHFRELMPTVGVPRGSDAAVPFVQKIDMGIDSVSFTPIGSGKAMSWRQAVDANYTDGIIVLHKERWCMSAMPAVLTRPGSMARCR